MNLGKSLLAILSVATFSISVASAQVSPLDAAAGDSYYYVDHYHLYDDFYIEVAKDIRDKMILLVNLPNSQEGEDTQGIAMISVHEAGEGTIVSIFMSRIYFWFEAHDNALRERRESREFAESRRASYEDDVLRKLQDAVNNEE